MLKKQMSKLGLVRLIISIDVAIVSAETSLSCKKVLFLELDRYFAPRLNLMGQPRVAPPNYL